MTIRKNTFLTSFLAVLMLSSGQIFSQQDDHPLFTAWIVNDNGELTEHIDGGESLVNVQRVEYVEVDGEPYARVRTQGLPNYETQIDGATLEDLNSRPFSERDFRNGAPSVNEGDSVSFGEDIGYNTRNTCPQGEGFGYWPPGPECPSAIPQEVFFPLNPQPSTEFCETGLVWIGLWVNGTAIFNWEDSFSYNNEGTWLNNGSVLEARDLDICSGHSAAGIYHHHTAPTCLGDQLGDDGQGHSPIYGFAADGYPVYGPYHDIGVFAQSCWKTRDYDSPDSPTGCGEAGARSCLLVDPYDISKGTIPAPTLGPRTDQIVTSLSRNEFLGVSGMYFQDYYYDPSCSAQGVEFLDEHNGHDHDGLGYHYHVTAEQGPDGKLDSIFPYSIGPTFAGQLQANAITACGGLGPGGGGQRPAGGGQGQGGRPPQGGGPQGGQPPQGERPPNN